MDAQDTVYTISGAQGLIRPAEQRPSPNQDDRPGDCEPDLIIIHGISLPPGEFGGSYVEQLFMNCLDWDAHPYFEEIRGLTVSSHVFIRRDGSLIQFVPFERRAWHAGASCYRDRQNCNDFSIGIELEGEDDTAYADSQYDSLINTVLALQATYTTLCARRIAGHCDVAPNRKSDPGPAFDWLRLYDGLGNNTEKP
jgi:AmpD protein